MVAIWLATAVVVAALVLWWYDRVTQVPEFAGRTHPRELLSDPGLLFEEPGILGSAVEMRVTEAVRSCMADAGHTYRGPVRVEGLDDDYDPAVNGYGIAAPLEPPTVRLDDPVRGSKRAGYERALYGDDLDDTGSPGGCAAVGAAELDRAVAELNALPYSLEEFEADVRDHPAYRDGLDEWSECMDEAGYDADTPDDLIVDLTERLAEASGDEARELAEEERRIAAADFACRERTLDPALEEVAEDLAPEFVDRNRTELEAFVPADEGGGLGIPPELGSGDVQVTLLWSSTADIDLNVTDPAGDLIYFGERESPSGGRLDKDAMFPCGSDSGRAVENVFWPAGEAPSGTYRAGVVYVSDCAGDGAEEVELIVQVRGSVVEHERRTLQPGESFDIEFRVP